MSVRDRYDVGKEVTYAAEQRAGYIRNMIQRSTEQRALVVANDAVKAGTAGSFAVALIAAWHEQRRQEGWG